MLPEKADQMLRDYKVFLGRCKYLSALIPELKAEAAALRDNAVNDLISVSSQNLDGMPHGTSVGNPTERIAIILADGYTSEGVIELEKQITAYEAELRDKLITVRFVEAWLDGLSEKERWIVHRQVIEGAYWREIVHEYRTKYSEEYTKDGLKRIRDAALEKIHRMAS